MDIEWRGVTHGDVGAWCRLLAAVEQVDETGEHFDEPDLHEELDDPATGPEDRISAWVDGRMVAYAGVRPRATVTHYWRVDAEGAVHPGVRGKGVGSACVAWALQRSADLQAERHPDVETRVQVTAYLDNEGQVALLEGAGFRAVNWSAIMRVPLSDVPAEGGSSLEWPDGLRLHTYDPSTWSARTLDAHNCAFADHWGFVPWTPEMWAQWVDGTKNSRHELSWVLATADRPECVVGYLLTNEFDANRAATGRREAYLAKLGVRPEFRGCGLASRLIRHALWHYAAAGYDESSLDVDTANSTGAFGLYERAGYRVERRTATYEHRLGAAHLSAEH